MKHSLRLIVALTIVGATSSHAADVLPPRFNFDRYSAMVERSPFAIATAAALPEATPNFAKDLYVANAAHSPEGDLVTIASTADNNFKKYLTTKEPMDGYAIASIEWSDKVGATKVTISKDGNFATLTFNEALLAQRPGAPAMPSQVQPLPVAPVPGGPQALQRPGPAGAAGTAARNFNLPAPSLVTPGGGLRGLTRPRARGVIPKDPNAQKLAPPPKSN